MEMGTTTGKMKMSRRSRATKKMKEIMLKPSCPKINRRSKLADYCAAEDKEMKQARKQAKKDRKRAMHEAKAEGSTQEVRKRPRVSSDQEASGKEQPSCRIGGRGSRNRESFDQLRKDGQRVVIDLSFDDLMTEKEVRSLVTQLAHSYGTNRASGKPLDLYLTSVDKRTAEGLKKISGFDNWRCHVETRHFSEVFPKNEELQKDKVYCIGGIVDHNRLKGLTKQKADENGWDTAKLPLDGNIDLGESRKVLTVNHVCSILLKYHETGNWKESLKQAMPERKLK
ncbi:hypothetical protein GUITHDRAFT_98931 [Guillardia theta CCMP2712]|uniref:tRNA (guanine(9)-N(1))-methyltransferase n=1 Tax=Guillardia theta (strain CCMP2712) TaxID=905079 RepID=L1K3I4_GUITC|nr:hypothetical protein GUITHDRAFT_98931 [Guillardia theta CCMP2712]EKX55147.1 hypothetical protein GUITHDRAFT_98931 [Guillardia theta CCMP2712]|eukprot:XP_005842127.1 hypothetical protein GUITHDRAFT_98931 [Guillardia theta CCMP2712]